MPADQDIGCLEFNPEVALMDVAEVVDAVEGYGYDCELALQEGLLYIAEGDHE